MDSERHPEKQKKDLDNILSILRMGKPLLRRALQGIENELRINNQLDERTLSEIQFCKNSLKQGF